MKTLKIIAITLLMFVSCTIRAQVKVDVNVGKPPVWGPVVTTQEYYYLPDINSYYDINRSQYVYLNRGTWVRSKSLPVRYRGYNLNTGNVVVINDYHGRSPYVHYKAHKVKYYKANNNWAKSKVKSGNNGNGNSNGKGTGNGKGNKKGKK